MFRSVLLSIFGPLHVETCLEPTTAKFFSLYLEAMTQLRLTLTMDQITLQRLTLFKIMVIDTLEKNVSVLAQNSLIHAFFMGPQLLVYKLNFWQLRHFFPMQISKLNSSVN